MGVKFLTEDWVNGVNAALNAHDGFKAAAAGIDLALQFAVSGAPEGCIEISNQARPTTTMARNPAIIRIALMARTGSRRPKRS